MKVRTVNKSKHQIPDYSIKDCTDIDLRENICVALLEHTETNTGDFGQIGTK